MRLVRYSQRNEAPRYGWIYEDKIGPVDGNPFGDFRRLEATIPVQSVRLLAPVTPGKIICVGRNYAAHAKEHGVEVPEVPIIFLKPPSAVIGSGEPIVLPPQSQQVEHEAELALVVGRRGRWIKAEEALSYLYGYTIGNDVTARDLQHQDLQWTRSKSFDTFCPLGPWVDTNFDPSDVMINCHVNDELRQMGSTRDMVFSPKQIVAFISSIMTVEPGDVIMTGSPAGVSPIKPGDRVRVSIERLGAIENPVIAS